jgi:predicted amidohydrolase
MDEECPLKIATAQTIVSADIAANGSAIRLMIARAAAGGARIINFCEGALSGYSKFQIPSPDDWARFDWEAQEHELRAIGAVCRQERIVAAVGGAHRLSGGHPPHNCLYIVGDDCALLTRYDKRFLSNSELGGWYTPGKDPVVIEVDDYRFGFAICVESQFQEVFLDYERLGVDAVLFSSYGVAEYFQIALRAHAALNCLWITAATPVQKAAKGPAGVIGPDGNWIARCSDAAESDLAIVDMDRNDPAYDIPLGKVRPWRSRARQGDIYRAKMVDDPRNRDRTGY